MIVVTHAFKWNRYSVYKQCLAIIYIRSLCFNVYRAADILNIFVRACYMHIDGMDRGWRKYCITDKNENMKKVCNSLNLRSNQY